MTVYVEEMKQLFRHADLSLSEDKKVRFLMKGVKEQLFAGLVRSTSATVADFVSEAASIEKSLDMQARQYQRTTVSMIAASAEGTLTPSAESLRELIRALVREEVAKYLPTAPQPQVVTFYDVVREEVQQALGISPPVPATPPPQPLSYAVVASCYVPPPTPRYEPSAPAVHVSPSRPNVV